MDQLCFNSGESVLAIATSVIAAASFLANIVPAPNETSSKVMKVISKIIHFAAVDIVTVIKK